MNSQKKNADRTDASSVYRRLDNGIVRAPKKKNADPRVTKTTTNGDLRAPKGR